MPRTATGVTCRGRYRASLFRATAAGPRRATDPGRALFRQAGGRLPSPQAAAAVPAEGESEHRLHNRDWLAGGPAPVTESSSPPQRIRAGRRVAAGGDPSGGHRRAAD